MSEDNINVISVRIPQSIIKELDKECSLRVGIVSRNTLILEILSEALERKKD